MKKYNDITGVILAGGRSSRFGSEKGLAVFDGMSFAARVAMALRPFVAEVHVVSRGDGYGEMADQVYGDRIPGKGPLGGLHAALQRIATPWLLLVACDMPMLTGGAVAWLCQQNRAASDAVVPLSSGRCEALFALYHKRCLPVVEAMLQDDERAMHELLERIETHRVDWPEHLAGTLRNVNTTDMLHQLKQGAK